MELSEFSSNQAKKNLPFLIKPQSPADAWQRLFGFETYGSLKKKKKKLNPQPQIHQHFKGFQNV